MWWKLRTGDVLMFPKVFVIFGYQKMVYLVKRQLFSIRFGFSKVFGMFGSQKVVYLPKRQPFCTNVAIPAMCVSASWLTLKKCTLFSDNSYLKSLPFFRERDRPRFSRYQADNRYQEHSPWHMCVEKDLWHWSVFLGSSFCSQERIFHRLVARKLGVGTRVHRSRVVCGMKLKKNRDLSYIHTERAIST